MRSSVDFPQPLGPTMQTNSPGATRRSTWSSATTVPCAPAYSRRRPAISIAAPRRWTSWIALRCRVTALQRQPGMLAVLVLDHERAELLHGVLDVARVDQPLGGELRR